MDEWFRDIQSKFKLEADTSRRLHKDGFVVIPGPIPTEELAGLSQAYDAAMASADPRDVGVGSTTTRVQDFVNRGPEFDSLYKYAPILAAACEFIHRPFKLSSMLARTLRPFSPPQKIHVDMPADGEFWTMMGFILMVDEFQEENGATHFVIGSHHQPQGSEKTLSSLEMADRPKVPACGPAGSVILYNGSAWHGHGANRTNTPRRSIQGAYIRREAKGWFDQLACMVPETLARISPLARYLLGYSVPLP